jgi:hypothetical protein
MLTVRCTIRHFRAWLQRVLKNAAFAPAVYRHSSLHPEVQGVILRVGAIQYHINVYVVAALILAHSHYFLRYGVR